MLSLAKAADRCSAPAVVVPGAAPLRAGRRLPVCRWQRDKQTSTSVQVTKVLSIVYLKSQLFISTYSIILFFFHYIWTHFQIDNHVKIICSNFIVKQLAFFVPLSLRVM